MAAIDKKFKSDAFTRIYDVWARKNPGYEKHYEAEVIKPLTDFGLGTNEASEAKGKVLGAGYEALIMAFFIGLYSDKKVPFDQYADIKELGQPIQYWGNLDSKKGRKAYSRLREYIFVAIVARTPEIDWIAICIRYYPCYVHCTELWSRYYICFNYHPYWADDGV